MIQASVAKLLQGLARSEASHENYPAFLFLDAFGEQIAAGFPNANKLTLRFAMGKSGLPEPHWLPENVECLTIKVDIYGNPVGYLVTLYRKGSENKAKALSEFAKSLVAFAAEKNFELDDLSAALNRLFEERAFLYEITAELGDSADLPDFCVRLAKRVASILEAPRALVLLSSENRQEYKVAGTHGIENCLGKVFSVSEGVCGSVIQSGKPQLVEDVQSWTGAALSPLEAEGRRCLLAAPIVSGSSGGPMGALCVMDGGRSGTFTSEEVKLLSFIAEYVASVVSGLYLVELKKEVQIAQRIVEGLLPEKPPQVASYTLAGKLSPARVVGGDYFDFLSMANGKTGVVIADVSGHTLPATLLMTVARAAFHWAAADSVKASSAEILHTVSRRLFEDLSSAEFFMSMFLLVLGEKGKITYSNAGHPPAILYRSKENSFEELDAEGMVAGILREIDFEEKSTVLGEDDLLILYTDGITEATKQDSQEMFGVERLKEAIQASAKFPAEEIVETIFQSVTKYAEGNPADDLTVVVLKGAPVAAAVELSKTSGRSS